VGDVGHAAGYVLGGVRVVPGSWVHLLMIGAGGGSSEPTHKVFSPGPNGLGVPRGRRTAPTGNYEEDTPHPGRGMHAA
jgi:hypothetical protein